jgi:hypothetical protein
MPTAPVWNGFIPVLAPNDYILFKASKFWLFKLDVELE